jgi:DNA-binding transcriptional regulator YiaG
MENKYNSDFLESLHETAVGLHNIGVINDKEMLEYDRDCFISSPEKSSSSTSTPVKTIPAYAEASPRA